MSDVLKATTLAAFGLAEGYAFARSGIVAPQAFRDQMEFKSFIVMKLFFSAVGFSMVGQSAMSIFDKDTFEESRFYTYSQVGFKRAMSGCFLLGVGMYASGSGPTMIAAQIGAGTEGAFNVITGALLGAAAYAVAEPFLLKTHKVPEATKEETSLDGKLGTSYAAVALPMGLTLLGATMVLEHFFPHAQDLQRLSPLHIPSALLPIVAGATVGLNQIPIRKITKDGQGGSTCLMNVVSTITNGLFSPRHKARSVKDLYQLIYVYVGTGLGAYLAVSTANGAFAPAAGLPAASTIAGAALMVFGARFANGCTCGHGISGMSELSISSIAAGMSIFAGGIMAGVAKNVLGL